MHDGDSEEGQGYSDHPSIEKVLITFSIGNPITKIPQMKEAISRASILTPSLTKTLITFIGVSVV